MRLTVEEYRFTGGGSDKYWRVVESTRWTLFQWGRWGNNPQSSITSVGGSSKKITEKVGKGYQLVGTANIDIDDAFDVPMTKGDAKRVSDEVEHGLNRQGEKWGGIDRRSFKVEHDDLDELLGMDPAPEPDPEPDTFAQRAFRLMTQAATDPDAALVEFTILRDEAKALREDADEAESHVNTLAMMLNMEERV